MKWGAGRKAEYPSDMQRKRALLVVAACVAFSWASDTAGQNNEPECGDDTPYTPRTPPSGRVPKLPAVAQLDNRPTKVGAAYTVFGAWRSLRSLEPRAGDITIAGKAATDPKEKLRPCAGQSAWPTGDDVCHLRLTDESGHVTAIVTGATKTSGSPPNVGDALEITGGYGPGWAGRAHARFDPMWGLIAAKEVKP